MVRKVQVVSDEEAKRYNQWQKDLDDTCDKIKIYVCLCICILVWVYMIVLIITSIIYFHELDESDKSDESNLLILDSGSLSQ